MNDEDRLLSEAGEARRLAMRAELMDAMGKLHRRRRVRRRAVMIGVPVLIAAIATALMLNHDSKPEKVEGIARDPQQEPIVEPVIDEPTIIVRVATDRGILERCRIQSASGVERLDDEKLLNMLQQINRPAGLIVMDGQVRLTAPVADAPAESRG